VIELTFANIPTPTFHDTSPHPLCAICDHCLERTFFPLRRGCSNRRFLKWMLPVLSRQIPLEALSQLFFVFLFSRVFSTFFPPALSLFVFCFLVLLGKAIGCSVPLRGFFLFPCGKPLFRLRIVFQLSLFPSAPPPHPPPRPPPFFESIAVRDAPP